MHRRAFFQVIAAGLTWVGLKPRTVEAEPTIEVHNGLKWRRLVLDDREIMLYAGAWSDFEKSKRYSELRQGEWYVG